MIKQILGAAALAAAVLALPAQAVEFNAVQADKTQIAFTYKQLNVPVDGKFRKSAASIAFGFAPSRRASRCPVPMKRPSSP